MTKSRPLVSKVSSEPKSPPIVAPPTQYNWLRSVTQNINHPRSIPSGILAVKFIEKDSSQSPYIKQQHRHRNKFQRTSEYHRRHDHGIPKRKSRYIHVHSVGHTEKKKPRKNRNRIWKSCPEGIYPCIIHSAAALFSDLLPKRFSICGE